MTLISFFDEDPLDNIGDILFLKPDVCVFLGENGSTMERHLKGIRKVLDNRKLPTQIIGQSVPFGDMASAKDILTRLICKHPDAILDVTGGSEMLIALAGNIADVFDVPIYQRRNRSSRIHWQERFMYPTNRAHLSVADVVCLHGGAILSAQTPPRNNDALTWDIRILWDIARRNMSEYNALCNNLSFLMKRNKSTDPLELVSDPEDYRCATNLDRSMLTAMNDANLIQDLSFENDTVQLRFRNYEIRNLITKAGCLLEIATCIAAGRTSDSAIGVSMDWDGVLSNSTVETKNELDVMLIYGMMPVCISCKNGHFEKEALYELDTVSRHFAGRFAKRIFVASYVDESPATVANLKERARVMGITTLFNVQNYTFDEFAQKLQSHLPRNEV